MKQKGKYFWGKQNVVLERQIIITISVLNIDIVESHDFILGWWRGEQGGGGGQG